MTIITKPITEKKNEKTAIGLLGNANDVSRTGGVDNGLVGDLESQQGPVDPSYVMLRARARRVSSATTLCLFLTALVVMSVGIIGGTYLYRQYVRAQMHRFKGWCTIPLDASNSRSAEFMSQPMLADSNLFPSSQLEAVDRMLEHDANELFKENFELDLDDEQYEKIDVPDFQGGRRGRFIHDFYVNKTAIIDIDNKRCFVMPLNRGMVLPPRSLFDLIQKMWDGYYEVDTERVRETMRVIQPPVADMKDMGNYINTECKNMTVYQLEKYNPSVVKRSIPSESSKFVMFAGHKTLEFDILNFDDQF